MEVLFRTARSIGKRVLRHHCSRNHLRAARGTLEMLERRDGPLSAADRGRCDAYAVEVLGHAKFAPWLYVYSHVAGEFREGWIPDNFFDECVLPHNSGRHGELSQFRSLNGILFDAPEFPDLAVQINGMVIGRDGKPVARKDLTAVLFGQGDRIVFKSDATQSGLGLRVLDRASFDPDGIGRLGAGVFQPFVRQHPEFHRIGNSTAVTTLRLTTATDDSGTPQVRAAFLCIGMAGDVHIRAGTDALVPVDPATGEMSPVGYVPDWQRTDRHPDSGVLFAGFELPEWEACRDVALRYHARLPFVRCIGWDVTVDDQGAVRILEWNGGHTGIKFTEATQGPCFADLGWHRLRRPT
ncbi:sugar-transfer associated ATP-grasp domain-containing protein [Tabrizicola flagellatus]|uniref:sugar-transfer associated ATP-grasp domain-containing protein n=1 Tax=Tabrizicola flagellatus TaxID=2593021 RepID=UPI00135AEB85|nr:sugar-transfer associated ATP-grasp domain-containing protein [Tabrizicola flagellatus]